MCQDWWNCTEGGLIIPEVIIIIIPVMMHSYWYCLTHRNIATSLILYQKLDLNNTPGAVVMLSWTLHTFGIEIVMDIMHLRKVGKTITKMDGKWAQVGLRICRNENMIHFLYVYAHEQTFLEPVYQAYPRHSYKPRFMLFVNSAHQCRKCPDQEIINYNTWCSYQTLLKVRHIFCLCVL